jgi:hypothetical protein
MHIVIAKAGSSVWFSHTCQNASKIMQSGTIDMATIIGIAGNICVCKPLNHHLTPNIAATERASMQSRALVM